MLRAMVGRDDCAILGAACPRRMLNWRNAALAAEAGLGDADPAALGRFSGEFALHFLHPDQSFALTDLVELTRVGSGMMMIRRDVFDRLRASSRTRLSHRSRRARRARDRQENLCLFSADDRTRHAGAVVGRLCLLPPRARCGASPPWSEDHTQRAGDLYRVASIGSASAAKSASSTE